MKKEDLLVLDNEKLIWVCVEPVISKLRGENALEKLRVFRQLGDGLRALFMFQVMHGHMEHGTIGFYAQISYLSEQLNIWAALKSGMRYFELDGMIELIGNMEKDYELRADGRGEKEITEKLDDTYLQLIPAAVRIIAERIRSNPDEFIPAED